MLETDERITFASPQLTSKFISQSNSSSKWPSKGVSLLSARSTASGKPRSLAEPVVLARPQAGGCLELVMKLSKLKNVGGLQLDTTLVRFSSSWKLRSGRDEI